jgi:hypothetical protein
MMFVKRAEDVTEGDLMVHSGGRVFVVLEAEQHADVTGANLCLTAAMVRHPADGYSRHFTNTSISFCYPQDLVLVTDRGVA